MATGQRLEQGRAAVLGWQRTMHAEWQRQAGVLRVPREPGADRDAKVRAVIDRAKSQLGVPYAWGGGNANGPTKGVRDGGVADRFGDYNKIGFDCSGLMEYAFAGSGASVHRPAAAESFDGPHVPLSQIQPGDMVFYRNHATKAIHHVALYVGDGQMIEAPESGKTVRMVPLRRDSELEPYATRAIP